MQFAVIAEHLDATDDHPARVADRRGAHHHRLTVALLVLQEHLGDAGFTVVHARCERTARPAHRVACAVGHCGADGRGDRFAAERDVA